uniref:Cysteine string protein n=1 Tax=Heterorhabditis bacteriophora TaxID=37862 RepID=A0A1I7XD92_HETBA
MSSERASEEGNTGFESNAHTVGHETSIVLFIYYFKEINYANGVLSNPNKRKVYDEMGDTGLKLMEQFGEDEKILQWLLKPWFKWVFFGFGLFTCGFFCCCCGCMCCCKCCCNFCCGKYVPKEPEENVKYASIYIYIYIYIYYHTTDEDDLADSENGSPQIIITQPGSGEEPTTSSGNIPTVHCPSPRGANGEEPIRPTVIPMPPPSGYGTIESSH